MPITINLTRGRQAVFPDGTPQRVITQILEEDYPIEGEDIAEMVKSDPHFEPTFDEYQKYEEYVRDKPEDFFESAGGFFEGMGHLAGVAWESGKAAVKLGVEENLNRLGPNLMGGALGSPKIAGTVAESFMQGSRELYGMGMQSQDPDSLFFRWKDFIQGEGEPGSRFEQFLDAREFARRTIEMEDGRSMTLADMYQAMEGSRVGPTGLRLPDLTPEMKQKAAELGWDKGIIPEHLSDPEVVKGLKYIADPTVFVPGIGQFGKGATLGAKGAALGMRGVGSTMKGIGGVVYRTGERAGTAVARTIEETTGVQPSVIRGAGLAAGVVTDPGQAVAGGLAAARGTEAVGGVLGRAGEIMAEGPTRRGLFSETAQQLAEGGRGGTLEARLARGLSLVDRPLAIGGQMAEAGVHGALIGGALGYGTGGAETMWQGAGGGFVMGGVIGGVGGLAHQTFGKDAWAQKRYNDVFRNINKMDETTAAWFTELTKRPDGVEQAAMIFDVQNFFEGVLGDAQVKYINEPDSASRGFVPSTFETEGRPQLTINIGKLDSDYTIGHEMFHGLTKVEQLQPMIHEIRREIAGMWEGGVLREEGLLPGARLETLYDDYVKKLAVGEANTRARRQIGQAQKRGVELSEPAKDRIRAAELENEVVKVTEGHKTAEDRAMYIVDEIAAENMARLIKGGGPDTMMKAFDTPTRRAMDWAMLKFQDTVLGGITQRLSDMGVSPYDSMLFPDLAKASPALNSMLRQLVRARKNLGEQIKATDDTVKVISKREVKYHTDALKRLDLVKQDEKGNWVLKDDKDIEVEEMASEQALRDILSKSDPEGFQFVRTVDKSGNEVTQTVGRRFSPEQISAIEQSATILPTVKRAVREFSDAVGDGSILNITYYAATGRAYNRPHFRATGKKRYRSKYSSKIKVSNRSVLPYTIWETNAGNFVIRAVDWTKITNDITSLASRKKLGLWDNRPSKFFDEFTQYLSNQSSLDPQASAKMFGEAKADFFHDTLQAPERRGTGKKYIRTFRLDRMDGITPTREKARMTEQAWRRSEARQMPARLDAPKLEGPVRERVSTTGQYVGAPPRLTTPQALGALRKKMDMLTVEGQPGRYWYEQSSDAILEATGGNLKDAETVAALIAIYSAANKVYPNHAQAIKAFQQHKAGKPIKAGRFKARDREALRALNGERWEGVKTNNFYVNLMRNIDPTLAQGVTVDMWIMRLFGYDTDSPSTQQYAFAEKEIKRIADKMGWEPQQVQAAMWVSGKARWEEVWANVRKSAIKKKDLFVNEDTGGWQWRSKAVEKKYRKLARKKMFAIKNQDVSKSKFDFSDAARRDLGQLSLESRPGPDTGVLPGMQAATYKQQLVYHAAIDRAMTDSAGRDALAADLGLMEIMSIHAPGVWLDQINPSKQTTFIAPKQEKQIHPALREMVNELSAFHGLLRWQHEVGWHRPYWTDIKEARVGEANGMQLDVGRTLTPEETHALSEALLQLTGGDNFAAIAHSKGIRFLNFTKDNVSFHKQVRAATETVFAMRPEMDAELGRFYADNDLIVNDWKANPNGENYRHRLLASRRSDLYRRHYRLLAPKVDQVNATLSGKYGWGEPGRHLADLDPASAATSRPVDTSTRHMPDVGGQDALGMFSAAERATVNLKQEKGTASQMLAMIKKSGVKDEELQVLGLDKFLEGNRRVSKDEIIDHLVENQITVEEVVLGEVLPPLERLPGEYETGSRERVIRKQEYAKELKAKYDQVLDRLTEAHGKLSPTEQKQVEAWDKSFNDWIDYWGHPRIQNEPSGSHVDVMRWANEVLPETFNESLFSPDVVKEWIVFEGGDKRKVRGRGRSKNEAESDALQNINDLRSRPDAATKHASYVEPGAVEGSYRELLLKLPDRKEPSPLGGYTEESKAKQYTGGHYGEHPNVLAHVRFNERDSLRQRVDGVGRTLHVEEFQSDWHQAGRKKGYADPVAEAAAKAKAAEEQAPLRAELDVINERLEAYRKEHGPVAKLEAELDALNQKVVTPTTRIGDIPEHLIEVSRRIWADKEFAKQYHADNAELGKSVVRLQERINSARREGKTDHKHLMDVKDDAYRQMDAERNVINRELLVIDQKRPRFDTVPDAPFKTSWHELAMKRMIRYAVDNGYDALSWTKGETQAARYDLSKQVAEIWYQKHEDGTYSFDVIGKVDDADLMSHARVGPDVVEANIGKDMLRNMDARKGKKSVDEDIEWRILKGEDLKVGGEFHKNLYDRKLVRMKTWKKLGLKVESADLGRLDKAGRDELSQAMYGRDFRFLNPDDAATVTQNMRAEKLSQPLPAHIVRLTPEVKAKVLDGGLARFMPDSGAPNTSRNALGWSLIQSKVGKWHVYRPDGTLAGIGGSKRSAENLFRTHYKRELRKSERAGKTRFMPSDDVPAGHPVRGFDTTKGDTPNDIDYLRAGGKLRLMSPDEYIDKAVAEFIAKDRAMTSRESVLRTRVLDEAPWVREQLERGEAMPLSLDTTKRYPVQEGLHRALAAKEMGLEVVPVIYKSGPVKKEAPVIATDDRPSVPGPINPDILKLIDDL